MPIGVNSNVLNYKHIIEEKYVQADREQDS